LVSCTVDKDYPLTHIIEELQTRLIVPFTKATIKGKGRSNALKRKREDDVIFVCSHELRHGHRVVRPGPEEVIDLTGV
jgi:hypothetical protein